MTPRFSVALLLALFIGSSAPAAPPQTMNYQGRMKLTSGAAVADSNTHTLQAAIYNVASGGTALWTETHTGVSTTAGLFNVVLGKNVPINLPFDAPYWLGINFNSNGEMSPRSELATAPYAFRAKHVDLPQDQTVSMGATVFKIVNNGSGNVVEGHSSNAGATAVFAKNTASSGRAFFSEGGALFTTNGAPSSVSFQTHVDFSGAQVTGLNPSVPMNLIGPVTHPGAVLFAQNTSTGRGIDALASASYTAAVRGSSSDTTAPGPSSLPGRGLEGSGPIGVYATTNISNGVGLLSSVSTTSTPALYSVNTGGGAGLEGSSKFGVGLRADGYVRGVEIMATGPGGVGIFVHQSAGARALESNGNVVFQNGYSPSSVTFSTHVHFSGVTTGLPSLSAPLSLTGTSAASTLSAFNTSTGYAIYAKSNDAFASAIYGENLASNNASKGVYGYSQQGTGVYAQSSSGVGLYAESVFDRALVASGSSVGVSVSATNGTSAWGVIAQAVSWSANAKGVIGSAGGGLTVPGGSIGVYGWGVNVGVEGSTPSSGGTGVRGVGGSVGGAGVEGRGFAGVKGAPGGGGIVGVLADWNNEAGAVALKVSGPARFDMGSVTFASHVDFSGATVTGLSMAVSAPLSLTSTTGGAVALYAHNSAGGTAVLVSASVGAGAAMVVRNSSNVSNAYGLLATANGTSAPRAAVLGSSDSTFNNPFTATGVYGYSFGGTGVLGVGTSAGSKGVVADGVSAGLSATASNGSAVYAYGSAASSPTAYFTKGAVNGTTVQVDKFDSTGGSAVFVQSGGSANPGYGVMSTVTNGNTDSAALYGRANGAQVFGLGTGPYGLLVASNLTVAGVISNSSGRALDLMGGTIGLSATASAAAGTAIFASASTTAETMRLVNNGSGQVLNIAANGNGALEAVYIYQGTAGAVPALYVEADNGTGNGINVVVSGGKGVEASGATVGVQGTKGGAITPTLPLGGVGVLGVNSTNDGYGGFFKAAGTSARGIVVDSSLIGVSSVAQASAGQAVGVYGAARNTSAAAPAFGVLGEASSSVGPSWGVLGKGDTTGVSGTAYASGGIGVYGSATNTINGRGGVFVGVTGVSAVGSAVAGLFTGNAQGIYSVQVDAPAISGRGMSIVANNTGGIGLNAQTLDSSTGKAIIADGGLIGISVTANGSGGQAVYAQVNSSNSTIYARNWGSGNAIYGFSNGQGESGAPIRGWSTANFATNNFAVYGRYTGTGTDGAATYGSWEGPAASTGDGIRGVISNGSGAGVKGSVSFVDTAHGVFAENPRALANITNGGTGLKVRGRILALPHTGTFYSQNDATTGNGTVALTTPVNAGRIVFTSGKTAMTTFSVTSTGFIDDRSIVTVNFFGVGTTVAAPMVVVAADTVTLRWSAGITLPANSGINFLVVNLNN